MEETYEQYIIDRYDPLNCRTWFFYPIYMPLDKNGNGPETRPGRVRKETWEVWDFSCKTYGSYECLPDAINLALELNKMLLEGKTIDEINLYTKTRH